VVRFRLSGKAGSSYWPLDDKDVGAVVFMAELVRSVELVPPFGVFVCDRY
jgi:hypothetical protein